MRAIFFLVAISMALTAVSQTIVPRHVWAVETSESKAHRLDLVYGETVDLECKFLSYQRPLDITGASVVLHARTNGQSEAESFQYAGTALTNGIAKVRLMIDEWLPQGLTNVSYTLEITQTNAARILRSTGTARLSGSSAGSSVAALPAPWYTSVTGRLDLAAAAAAFAYSPTNPPPSGGAVASVNGQTGTVTITAANIGALTNETDAAALAKLSTHTNRVDNPHGVTAAQVGAPSIEAIYTLMATSKIDRVWEGTNVWWTFASNTVTRKFVVADVTASVYLAEGAGYTPVDGSYYFSSDSPLSYTNSQLMTLQLKDNDHWEFYLSDVVYYYTSDSNPLGTYATDVPEFLYPPPTVTLFASAYMTNSTVYYLQTNLVPPETWSYSDQTNWMAAGSAGQIWASDLAASAANVLLSDHRRATNSHEGVYPLQTGGTMTNATLAGTVTIGGVARTSWPSSGSSTITNAVLFGARVVGNGSRGAAAGPLTVATENDQNDRLNIGVEPGVGAYMQSIWLGQGYTPILLQFSGGNVLIGTATDSGEKLNVEGTTKVSSTLTAGSIVSESSVSFGPLIGGNRARIFTDGTNAWFVSVNGVTNSL